MERSSKQEIPSPSPWHFPFRARLCGCDARSFRKPVFLDWEKKLFMKSHRLRLPVLVALALTAALRAQEIPVPLAPPAVPQQPAALPAPSAPDPNALKWDAETKEVNPSRATWLRRSASSSPMFPITT